MTNLPLKSIKQASKFLALTITLPMLFIVTIPLVNAQDDNAQRSEAREQRRAEMVELREQQREEFRTENPELAAEYDALRIEREDERTERDAAFREKYPTIAAQRDERRENPQGRFRQSNDRRGSGGAGQKGPERRSPVR